MKNKLGGFFSPELNICLKHLANTWCKRKQKQKKVEQSSNNWSNNSGEMPETGAFPNKMADVSGLMDKMTQILLPQAWCRGVYDCFYLHYADEHGVESSYVNQFPKEVYACFLSVSDICNYFTSTMTLSVDRSSCPSLIRHSHCRYFLQKEKKAEMAGLVRCVSKLVHVCVCPLGLLRPPLPQHHLGPQLQHLPRLDLLGLMQGG